MKKSDFRDYRTNLPIHIQAWSTWCKVRRSLWTGLTSSSLMPFTGTGPLFIWGNCVALKWVMLHTRVFIPDKETCSTFKSGSEKINVVNSHSILKIQGRVWSETINNRLSPTMGAWDYRLLGDAESLPMIRVFKSCLQSMTSLACSGGTWRFRAACIEKCLRIHICNSQQEHTCPEMIQSQVREIGRVEEKVSYNFQNPLPFTI